jgi:hypothetical protein
VLQAPAKLSLLSAFWHIAKMNQYRQGKILKKMQTISDVLRAAVEDAKNNGTPLYQVAAQAGVDNSSMHKWLSGERVLSGRAMESLAIHFRLVLAPVDEPPAKAAKKKRS